MPTVYRNRRLSAYALLLVGALLLGSFATSSVTLAQGGASYIRQVRVLDDLDIARPAGLAFSPEAGVLLVVEARTPAQPPAPGFDILRATLVEDRVGSVRVAASMSDPINMAFDGKAQRLLFLQSARGNLFEVRAGSDGHLDPTTLRPYNARRFGLEEPQGMTVDPASGDLFILDNAGPRLVRITPDAAGGFDQAVISQVDLGHTGLVGARGVAFDPTMGHLHVLSPAQAALYEVTATGQVVAVRDLTDIALGESQGMVFAPSGDLTDDPAVMSLYLADSGQTGAVIELSFIQPAAAAASTFPASLIQTIDTSQFSPPSPDPSGLAYLPSSGTLLIGDGEVDEMPQYFTGDNLFETTLSGVLVNTLTAFSFSDEPVGVDFNPDNGHLFISDDNGIKTVFEMNPGPDGLYDTPDDTITSFVTSDFGSTDPEGVTYANGPDVLFIADGLNNEVYRVAPGADGIFNGVPPTGDDEATSFDTAILGLIDPEGIVFNPDNGNLYVVGHPVDTLFELTTGGSLVQTIDISAANAQKPAGLARAPRSLNPAVMDIYIADRVVDNISDPNENDGKVYEMALGDIPPPDVIFANGFESGNFSVWSASKADGGNLSVSANAALIGAYGMQAVINDANTIYVTDIRPATEARYRARFYFNPNSITMAEGNLLGILYGIANGTPPTMRVQLRFSSGSYQLRGGLLNDAGSFANTAWVTINNAPHFIEFDWRAASAAGANDGGMTLWIDGQQQGNLTGVDNDTLRLKSVQLGAVAGIDVGTFGTVYFDAFESRRQTYIGPEPPSTNNPPVANDDSASTTVDTAVTINVAANDTDPDGNLNPASANTTCSTCVNPANGTLANNGNGSFNYAPNSGFIGSDSFVYEICDSTSLCDTASASIAINPPNAPPVANDDSVSTSEDTAVTINVAANDSDPDGNLNPASANTTCAGCANPANGTLVNNGNGSFGYTPNQHFNGSDSFVYQICDTIGACDTATVSITVTPVADPPVANADSASTTVDTAVTINVAANDTDPDGNLNPASANTACVGCANPANGTLVNNGNGSFNYTPNAGFTGSDSFVYEICDTTSVCDTASASITVNPVTASFRLSLASGGTVGGVASADDDILQLDGTNWSMFFDGSDVGVASVDLDAFFVVDADTILMSFDNPITIGVLGTVDDSDIVQFDATSLGTNTAGSFSMYFDGSDVGLDANAEDIDAIELLSNGWLLVSTSGSPTVTGVSGGRDEDLLAFTPTSLGDVTAGTWQMYFDGSDVGLDASTEDTDAVDVGANGDIYLSTRDVFAVTGVSGADEDVFVCTPTSLGDVTACTFSPVLYFDGSIWGLATNDVDAISLP